MSDRPSLAAETFSQLREIQDLRDQYQRAMGTIGGICSASTTELASLLSGDLIIPIAVAGDSELAAGYVVFYSSTWAALDTGTGGDLHCRLVVQKSYDGNGPDWEPVSDVLVMSKSVEESLSLGVTLPFSPQPLKIVRNSVTDGELVCLMVTATPPASGTRWWSIADRLLVTVHFQTTV